MKQIFNRSPDLDQLRDRAPQLLASVTFLFAGYGIGHITATLAKLAV